MSTYLSDAGDVTSTVISSKTSPKISLNIPIAKRERRWVNKASPGQPPKVGKTRELKENRVSSLHPTEINSKPCKRNQKKKLQKEMSRRKVKC